MNSYESSNVGATARDHPILIIGNAVRIAAEDFWAVVVTFALLTVPPIWAGMYLPEDDATRFSAFLGLAALVPQILLTERALARHQLIEYAELERPRYIFRAFGLSLVFTICAIIGLVALIIPGLVLLTRWNLSLPAMIARNRGIRESLQTSWEITKGHFWLCFIVIVLAWTPALIAIVILLVAEGLVPIFVADILAESLLSVSMLLAWFVSVALYSEITGSKMLA